MRNKIIITGSKGLIGGCLARRLQLEGYNLVLVDVYSTDDDHHIHMNNLFRWMQWNHEDVEFVFHFGANTDTMEDDPNIFDERNLGYSKSLWYACGRHRIPIIYSSCSSTYGDGNMGFSEDIMPHELKPLTLYGVSKNMFDKFVLQHLHFPPYWYGLKIFNAYGFDERHKGVMASLIYQSIAQIKQFARVKLFRHGLQTRDFIYVEDVVDAIIWMMKNKPASGIYNVGTGKSRSFKEVVKTVFNLLEKEPNIHWMDMPESMRARYQFFTEAETGKLKNAGYKTDFISIEEGIKNYLKQMEKQRIVDHP